MSPREGLFSSRPLPKRGKNCDIPPPQSLNISMCWRETSLSTISRVSVPTFFSGQTVVVDVEGVGFRPGAVVGGRGVVAGYTRISSQYYVHDK